MALISLKKWDEGTFGTQTETQDFSFKKQNDPVKECSAGQTDRLNPFVHMLDTIPNFS